MTFDEAQRITAALNSMNTKAQETESSFANVQNFKDPTELNSFADAVFNTRAKNSREWIRKIPDWMTLGGILPIKTAAAIADVAYTGGIKPLFGDSNGDDKPDWDFKSVAINGLYNLMETLDIVANPVKGAVIEGFDMKGSTEGLNAAQGFSRGLGMGAEGRTQYDYNEETGDGRVVDFVVNFALELVSDPLNLLEFGAGTVAKKLGKKAGEKILKESVERAGRTFVERVIAAPLDEGLSILRNSFGNEVADAFKVAAGQGPDAARQYMDTIGQNITNTFTASKQFEHITKQAAKDAATKGTNLVTELQEATKRMAANKFERMVWDSNGAKDAEKLLLTKDIYAAVEATEKTTLPAQANLIMNAMGKMYRMTDKAQQVLVKSVLMANPLGLGLIGAGAIGKKAWSKYANAAYLSRLLKQAYKPTQHLSVEGAITQIRVLKELESRGVAAAADVNPEYVALVMSSGAVQTEMNEVLHILATNKDVVIAKKKIAELISSNNSGKTVQEYLDTLTNASLDPTFSDETRALYAAYTLRLNGQLRDLDARAAAAEALGKLQTMAQDKEFFQKTIKQLRWSIRANNLDAAQETLNELLQHPRFLEYAEHSPALSRYATLDLQNMTAQELNVFVMSSRNVKAAIDLDFKPRLEELNIAKNAKVQHTSVFSYIDEDPITKMGAVLDKLNDVKFRAKALENKWIYDLAADAKYQLRVDPRSVLLDLRRAVEGVGLPIAKENAALVKNFKAAIRSGTFTDEEVIGAAVYDLLHKFEQDLDEMDLTKFKDRITELSDHLRQTLDDYETLTKDLAKIETPNGIVFRKAEVLREWDEVIDTIINNSFDIEIPQQIDAMSDVVGYVLKSAQINARLKLMQTEGLSELVDFFNSEEGIKELHAATLAANKLNNVDAETLDFTVEYLRAFCQSYSLEMEFMNKVIRMPTLAAKTVNVPRDEIVTAYLDAVQSYSKTPVYLIQKDFGDVITKIYAKVMGRVNGSKIRRSNKLADTLTRVYALDKEANAAKFSAMLNERFQKEALTFHDASDDIIAAMLIAEKNNPDMAEHIFAYDIETTPQHHAVQIAWRYGDQSGNYLIQTPKEMLHDNPAVVRKLSGLEDGHSEEEHFAAFWEKYRTAPYDERTALAEFFKQANLIAQADKSVRFVGHNIKNFDEGHLLARAGNEFVDPGVFADARYMDAHRYDTYLEEVQKYGYLDLEDEPELAQALADEFDLLVRTRMAMLRTDGETKRALFEQIDAFTAINMREVAELLDSTNSVYASRKIPDTLQGDSSVINFTRSAYLTGDPPGALREVALSIMERLRELKWTNKSVETILFDKSHIPDIAMEYEKEAMNITQLFSSDAQYFAGLSSKILVDTPLARTLFDADFVKQNVLLASDYARRIERTYNKLGDVEELLAGQSPKMKVLFNHLKAMLPKSITDVTKRSQILEHLRFPDSVSHQTAVLIWLLREVQNNTVSDGAATVSQTVLKNLRSAIGETTFDKEYAALFDKFNKGYRLYGAKTMTQVNDVVEATKKMATNNALTHAWMMVDECKTLQKFSNQQYDMFKQFYRFDTKYELAFASDLLDVMDNTLKVISDVANKIGDEKIVGRHLYNFNDAVFKNAARYVLGLRGAALRAHVFFNGFGRIRIDFTDWMNDPEMMGLMKKFLEETAGDGLGIAAHNRVLWITTQESTPRILKKDLVMPTIEDIKFEHDMPTELAENLLNVRQKIHVLEDGLRKLNKSETMILHSVNSTGTLISSEALEEIMADMPEALRKHLVVPKIARDTFCFDYSNIGSPALRNMAYRYATTNPIRGYNSVLQTYLAYADSALKMRLLLTSDSSFVRFSNLFDGVPDKEVYEALSKDRVYRVLMAIKADTPFGYRVKELRVRDIKDVAVLRESEAIVVDHNTHRMLRNVLNRGELTNGFAKLFNNVIISPTKAGMLTSPGVLLRNLIDSTIKNYLSLESSTEVAAFTAHVVESAKWLRIYKEDMKQILSLTQDYYVLLRQKLQNADIAVRGPNKKSIDAYFSGYDLLSDFTHVERSVLIADTDFLEIERLKATLTDEQRAALQKAVTERSRRRDIFDLTHTFIAQGPSAGYVAEQQELIDAAIKEMELREGETPSWDERIKRFAWGNPLTSNVMKFQSEIEQISRFSKFTWEIKNDASVAEAMHHVIDTHFDYSTKSTGVLRMELIVPFYTFALANMEFWTRLMSTNGWAFGMLRDLYSSTMNLSEYDQYELQNNRSLQYAILNGSVQLSDSGFSMKMAPSYMDVFNMFMEPFESGQQRIAKAIMIPVDIFTDVVKKEFAFDEQLAKDIVTGLPFAGVLAQRFWPSDTWSLKGAALRAGAVVETPLEKFAAYSLNSIFTATSHAYFFAYPSANAVWSTFDEETYFEQLAKGAVPVITTDQAKAIQARVKKYFYYGEKQYATYNPAVYERNIKKGATSQPGVKRKKITVSFRTINGYTRRSSVKYSSGVVTRTRGMSSRPFGRTLNLSYIAPAIWRMVYTAGGNDRFKVRLAKPTAKNLQYRIRMDSRYWR